MAPNKWFSADKESEIQCIVQKLTTTGKKTLDDGEMRKLKDICKSSDKYVNYVYYTLMTQLRKDHAEIRYSALLIVNELFCRSAVFRSKLQLDFEEFLELVEGTDPEKPLPLPAPVAKELKIKGLEFIKNWAAKFGEKYIRLQLALTYLKKCRKVDFDDMEARSIAQRERVRQEQERFDRVMNEKVSKVKNEMEELSEEISSVAIQMENCFRLLVPHPSDNLFSALDFEKSEAVHNDVGNEHSDKVNSSAFTAGDESCVLSASEDKLRHHGLYDVKRTISFEIVKNSEVAIAVNDDTVPIIENLKDLEKQISTRYYPAVTRWLKVLSKGNNCSDILKKAIDLKLLLESNLEKYKELKIKSSKIKIDSDDDDDDFEEVKEKEGYEESVKKVVKFAVRNSEQSCTKVSANLEKTPQFKFKLREEDIKDPTTALSTLSKRFKNCQPVVSNVEVESCSVKEQKEDPKKELLKKAPILPYDIDLYHWEEEKPLIPEVVRFDSLHKFWETKDDADENEALIEVQRASLRTRKIDFSGKFEPVKWTCRAPLPNGKLCPRRDRYKCPFHGKIIPRDALGNPSSDPGCIPGPSTEVTASTVPDWQDPQLLRDIEAATGIDLKIPDKKSKTGKKASKKKDGLTNIKQIKDTVRERLNKKIVKRYHHFAKKLDDIEKKRFDDKFGDQWNYY